MTDQPDLIEQLRIFRESHPWQMVKSTGQEWFYLSGGYGPPVVLLSGGGGSAENMFQLMAALEDEFQVVAISCPDDVTIVADISQAVTAVMEAQGILNAYILGHSLGAMFAECFMLKYPERAHALILANMAHFGTVRESIVRGVLSIIPYLPRQFVSRKLGEALKHSLAGSPDLDFWYEFLNFEITNATPAALASRANCMVDAIEHYPVKPLDLDGWNRRVFILESDNDNAFTPPERESLRRLYPDADRHIFRNAGHMSLYTHPEEFALVVKHFLKQ